MFEKKKKKTYFIETIMNRIKVKMLKEITFIMNNLYFIGFSAK